LNRSHSCRQESYIRQDLRVRIRSESEEIETKDNWYRVRNKECTIANENRYGQREKLTSSFELLGAPSDELVTGSGKLSCMSLEIVEGGCKRDIFDIRLLYLVMSVSCT